MLPVVLLLSASTSDARTGSRQQAAASASQLLTASVLMSVVVAILVLIFNRPLMGLMFGKVEDSVMDACVTKSAAQAPSFRHGVKPRIAVR